MPIDPRQPGSSMAPYFPPQFSEGNYAELITLLNLILNQLGLDNFAGQTIRDIDIPPDTTLTIPHNLRTTPRWRIILKQEGNGLITDGVYGLETVQLKNNSTTERVMVSIFLGGD